MEFHPNDLSDLDELTEEHLGFAALSDGLGFSKKREPVLPATKGVIESIELDFDQDTPVHAPAAPTKKNPPWMNGVGAVSAGPARYAPASPAKAVAPSAQTPVLQPKLELAAPQAFRLAAFGLDILFVAIPFSGAWFFSFRSEAWEIFSENPTAPLSLLSLIFVAYLLLSESFGGQSVGKMLLRLQVVEDDKYQKPTGLTHAFFRILLLALSAASVIGLLSSFWDKKRRPWQDRFSGSIVRRIE